MLVCLEMTLNTFSPVNQKFCCWIVNIIRVLRDFATLCVGEGPVWVPVVLAEKCFSQYCHVSHAKSELEVHFPGRISVYTWRVMPITATLGFFFF